MAQEINSKTHIAIAVFSVITVAAICYTLVDWMGYRSVALVLLLVVSILATRLSLLSIVIAAVVSAGVWDYFFIPPQFAFHINRGEDILFIVMYFIVALLNGIINYRLRQLEQMKNKHEERLKAIKLYNTLFSSLSHELRTPIAAILGASDALQEQDAILSEIQKKELIGRGGSSQTNPKPRSTSSNPDNDRSSSTSSANSTNNGTKNSYPRAVSTLELGTAFVRPTSNFVYNKISPFGIYVKRVLGFEMFLEDIPQFILTLLISMEMGSLSPYAVFSFTASGFNFLFNLLDMIELEHYEQHHDNNSHNNEENYYYTADNNKNHTDTSQRPKSVRTNNDDTSYNVYERMERS